MRAIERGLLVICADKRDFLLAKLLDVFLNRHTETDRVFDDDRGFTPGRFAIARELFDRQAEILAIGIATRRDIRAAGDMRPLTGGTEQGLMEPVIGIIGPDDAKGSGAAGQYPCAEGRQAQGTRCVIAIKHAGFNEQRLHLSGEMGRTEVLADVIGFFSVFECVQLTGRFEGEDHREQVIADFDLIDIGHPAGYRRVISGAEPEPFADQRAARVIMVATEPFDQLTGDIGTQFIGENLNGLQDRAGGRRGANKTAWRLVEITAGVQKVQIAAKLPGFELVGGGVRFDVNGATLVQIGQRSEPLVGTHNLVQQPEVSLCVDSGIVDHSAQGLARPRDRLCRCCWNTVLTSHHVIEVIEPFVKTMSGAK